MANNVVSALATFGTLIGDSAANYALITQGTRIIGDLYPHVVVEEIHHDELQITLHPVEFGTPITDHAFLQPSTVEIRCGWSNSNAQTSGYVQAVYQALLDLQSSRIPFNIATGKRGYVSMLMKSIMVHTDPDSEWTLMVVATAQHIVVTNTETSQTIAQFIAETANIGTVVLTPTGDPAPMVGNGVGTLNSGVITSDVFGNLSWPNDTTLSGTTTLNPTSGTSPYGSLVYP